MRQLGLIIGISLATLVARSALAGGCDCEVRCPSCHHVCKLQREEGKEKKSCWTVECKPICIPRITFPWQETYCSAGCGHKGCCGAGCSCCAKPQNGAKLRYVNVLVKHEYECANCKYKFTPVKCCSRKCAVSAPTEAPPFPPAAEAFRYDNDGVDSVGVVSAQKGAKEAKSKGGALSLTQYMLDLIR
jgi:hypothetical protein